MFRSNRKVCRDASRWFRVRYWSIIPESIISCDVNCLGSTYWHVLMFLLYLLLWDVWIRTGVVILFYCIVYLCVTCMYWYNYYVVLYRLFASCMNLLVGRYTIRINIFISTLDLFVSCSPVSFCLFLHLDVFCSYSKVSFCLFPHSIVFFSGSFSFNVYSRNWLFVV